MPLAHKAKAEPSPAPALQPTTRCVVCGVYSIFSKLIMRPWGDPFCADRYACFRRGDLMKDRTPVLTDNTVESWGTAVQFIIAEGERLGASWGIVKS